MMSACVTHPLDLVKVRLQNASKQVHVKPTMLRTFMNIVRHEGFLALYSGLSASLLRQATYSTTRIGVYEEVKSRLATAEGEKPSFAKLALLASASGWLGGFMGNGADVVNVRMQQDRALPPEKRRNYKNALDGAIRMAREEGPRSLFRGVWPNCIRAALMTASQLATYDQAKSVLLATGLFQDGFVMHFSASLLSGVIATTICSPVDVIKTRVMSSHDSHGLVHLLSTIFRNEGVSWMFRGWLPSFIRLGPHTILTLVALEQHKKIWRWIKEEDQHAQAL